MNRRSRDEQAVPTFLHALRSPGAADRLRARVEFHSNAQYDLGELLPEVIGIRRDLYKRAKQNQWDADELLPWDTKVDPSNPLIAC